MKSWATPPASWPEALQAVGLLPLLGERVALALRLELDAIGHVPHRAASTSGLAGLVGDRAQADLGRERRAVLASAPTAAARAHGPRDRVADVALPVHDVDARGHLRDQGLDRRPISSSGRPAEQPLGLGG